MTAKAQTQTPATQTTAVPISLQTAITRSLQVNPNIRAGNLSVSYQQALSGTVRDFGRTNINLTLGQYNSPIWYDNNITITQGIPNPVYLRRAAELAQANIDASRSQMRLY